MSDEPKQNSKLIRILRNIIFGSILILAPAMSWYYLSKGMEWRKKADSELLDYGAIKEAFAIYPDGTRENLLKSKVCVIHFFGEHAELTPVNSTILDTAEDLVDQFGFKPRNDRDDFRMVMIEENASSEFRSKVQKMPNSELANWVWTGGMGGWTTVMKNSFDYYCESNNIKPYPECYALADTSGRIRRFYNAEDPQEIGRMVEHIALILPK
jgi:hypothetical protein